MLISAPIEKINDAVEALQLAGLFISSDKLINAIPDKKYRCGTNTKPKGINGWYVVKCGSIADFVTIVYGNFENGDEKLKYHINLKSNDQHQKKLTPQERQELQAKIDNKIQADREKSDLERKRKAGYYVGEFNKLTLCLEHDYATRKGITNLKHYGLKIDDRFNRNLLCVPFHDEAGTMQGYQSIASDGTKRFNGSVGGYYWQYPLVNPNPLVFDTNNSFYVIGEGLATVLSAVEAINEYYDSAVFMAYALVAFNCGNLDKVIKATSNHNLPYLLLVDNDSTKPRNAGIETAKQLILDNSTAKIYPVTFPNGNDANDYILASGGNSFIELITKHTPIINKIEK